MKIINNERVNKKEKLVIFLPKSHNINIFTYTNVKKNVWNKTLSPSGKINGTSKRTN